MTTPRLLILGGTTEAAELAGRAVEAWREALDVVTSLAGTTPPGSQPTGRQLAGRVRRGGFGGIAGLTDYLRREAIDLVIDATHPFAARISGNAYAACLRAEVPRLLLLRPPWPLPPGAMWLEVEDLARAAEVLPRCGRRAFLTIGGRGLDAFSEVTGLWFLVRLMREPDGPPPLPDYQVVIGHPPYAEDEELRLLEKHRIDVLVTRNSGGEATQGKITAALRAGIRILAIARPLPEPGEIAETVDQAMNWLEGRI